MSLTKLEEPEFKHLPDGCRSALFCPASDLDRTFEEHDAINAGVVAVVDKDSEA